MFVGGVWWKVVVGWLGEVLEDRSIPKVSTLINSTGLVCTAHEVDHCVDHNAWCMQSCQAMMGMHGVPWPPA